MVGAVHHELHVFRDRAELADDQLVADEREVIQHVLLEALDTVGVVVVGVVTDDDVRTRYDVSKEGDLRESFHRMARAWIGPVQVVLAKDET
jgi:hypothetical protein